jgi:hypothetical protein
MIGKRLMKLFCAFVLALNLMPAAPMMAFAAAGDIELRIDSTAISQQAPVGVSPVTLAITDSDFEIWVDDGTSLVQQSGYSVSGVTWTYAINDTTLEQDKNAFTVTADGQISYEGHYPSGNDFIVVATPNYSGLSVTDNSVPGLPVDISTIVNKPASVQIPIAVPLSNYASDANKVYSAELSGLSVIDPNINLTSASPNYDASALLSTLSAAKIKLNWHESNISANTLLVTATLNVLPPLQISGNVISVQDNAYLTAPINVDVIYAITSTEQSELAAIAEAAAQQGYTYNSSTKTITVANAITVKSETGLPQIKDISMTKGVSADNKFAIYTDAIGNEELYVSTAQSINVATYAIPVSAQYYQAPTAASIELISSNGTVFSSITPVVSTNPATMRTDINGNIGLNSVAEGTYKIKVTATNSKGTATNESCPIHVVPSSYTGPTVTATFNDTMPAVNVQYSLQNPQQNTSVYPANRTLNIAVSAGTLKVPLTSTGGTIKYKKDTNSLLANEQVAPNINNGLNLAYGSATIGDGVYDFTGAFLSALEDIWGEKYNINAQQKLNSDAPTIFTAPEFTVDTQSPSAKISILDNTLDFNSLTSNPLYQLLLSDNVLINPDFIGQQDGSSGIKEIAYAITEKANLSLTGSTNWNENTITSWISFSSTNLTDTNFSENYRSDRIFQRTGRLPIPKSAPGELVLWFKVVANNEKVTIVNTQGTILDNREPVYANLIAPVATSYTTDAPALPIYKVGQPMNFTIDVYDAINEGALCSGLREAKILSDKPVVSNVNLTPGYTDAPSMGLTEDAINQLNLIQKQFTLTPTAEASHVKLSLEVKDNVDNLKVYNDIFEFSVDSTPPTVTVQYDNNSVTNGGYFNAQRKATVTVVDANLGDPSTADNLYAKILINGQEITNDNFAGTFTGGSISAWSTPVMDANERYETYATISFINDDRYTIDVSATDRTSLTTLNSQVDYGISSNPCDFVIDTLAPSISFPNANADLACANGFGFSVDAIVLDATKDAGFAGLAAVSYDIVEKIASNPLQVVKTTTRLDSFADASMAADPIVPYPVQNRASFDAIAVVPDDLSDSNNYYVRVTATDLAGNTTTEELGPLTLDKTAPIIDVNYDNDNVRNERYFSAPRTATITITDRTIVQSEQAAGALKTNGVIGAWHQVPDSLQTDGTNKWQATVAFSVDNDFSLSVQAKDRAGNITTDDSANYHGLSRAAQKEFTVDLRNPTINVTYSNNDVRNQKYFNQGRTATITLDEHNFSNAGLTVTAKRDDVAIAQPLLSMEELGATRTDIHVGLLDCMAEGDYSIEISYTDLSGRQATEIAYGGPLAASQTFTVDTTAPVLEFVGDITDLSAHVGVVEPSISLTDRNYDFAGKQIGLSGVKSGTITPDISYYAITNGERATIADLPHVATNDDIYTIKATLTDLAGNSDDVSLTYSLNRFGSTWFVNDATKELIDKRYTNKEQDVVIHEVNVNEVVKHSVVVAHGGSQSELKAGEYDVSASGSKTSWNENIYTLDKANFSTEGLYEITITSTDLAGNNSSNRAPKIQDSAAPVDFIVDKTAPTVVATGIESNSSYNDEKRTLVIDAEDNIALKEVEVYLNGSATPQITYTADDFKGDDGKVSYDIFAAESHQDISLKAVDMAGNEMDELLIENFFISADPFLSFMAQTPLAGFVSTPPVLYGLAIAFAIILAAIAFSLIFLFFFKRRRKEDEEENDNDASNQRLSA